MQTPEISYEVTISDELRALIRARQSARSLSPSAGRIARSRKRESAPYQDISLRQDGARPAKHRAMRLASVSVADTTGRVSGSQQFSLFLTTTGECIAQFVLEPPDRIPARPVFRVATVVQAGDVASMVEEAQANALLHVSSSDTNPPSYRAAQAAAQLKEQCQEMTLAMAPLVGSPQ